MMVGGDIAPSLRGGGMRGSESNAVRAVGVGVRGGGERLRGGGLTGEERSGWGIGRDIDSGLMAGGVVGELERRFSRLPVLLLRLMELSEKEELEERVEEKGDMKPSGGAVGDEVKTGDVLVWFRLSAA